MSPQEIRDASPFTEDELALLQHAGKNCCCESYYGYQCTKCRACAQGFVTSKPEALQRLKDWKFVYHDVYHGTSLTDAGLEVAEKLGFTVFPIHNKRPL